MTDDGATPSGEIEPQAAFAVAALYKFATFPDFADHRARLTELCEAHDICGTLLLAHEGINGTIAGTRAALQTVIGELEALPGFRPIDVKWSEANEKPFVRLKVRLKKEIVTLGVADLDPANEAGTYVEPAEWNALISDPDVVVIDTRNDYEVEIGTFEGAIDPKTQSFSEFPAWVDENLDASKHKKVAMFCTGGIRCEKATALLRARGFDSVYHLKGGILRYLEEVTREDSLWHGDCFVFDRRVGLRHGLEVGEHQLCSICRRPVYTGQGGGYLGDDCDACKQTQSSETRERARARREQLKIARARGIQHLGSRNK